MRGKILKGIGGLYFALDETGTVRELKAQGKFRREKMKPMVGDEIEMTVGEGEEQGWILSISPRRNQLVRPPVSNIDIILIVVAATSPEPDLTMVDRLMMNARMRGISPRLVINKVDLSLDAASDIISQYENADVCPMAVCAYTGEGLPELRASIKDKVVAFAGQSGVGKSSMINAMYGTELETGDISWRIERGKNTTRHTELIPVSDGMVLDTPGFSLLESPVVDPETVKEYYPEFDMYEGECFFQPCLHATEPKCAVLDAVKLGNINKKRHSRYVEIFEDMKILWRNRYD